MKKAATVIIAAFLFSACASTQKEETIETAEKAAKSEMKKASAVKGMAKKMKTSASSGSSSSSDALKCKLGKDMRNLDVKPTGKGCELTYTKFGNSKIAASSQYGSGYCQKVQSKIKGRLEQAGFKCE